MSRTADLRSLPIIAMLAASYTAGVVAGAILGGPPVLTALLAVAGCATIALALPVRGVHVAVMLAVAVVATAGHYRIQALDAEPPPALVGMSGARDVVGVVRDVRFVSGTGQRVDLSVETIDGEPHTGGISAWFRAGEGILAPGDRVRFTARLDLPPAIEAFDYAQFLRDRDIYLVANSVRSWDAIGRADLGWSGALRSFHQTVVHRIERAMPEPAAALSAGVLVGERSSLPPDVDEALRVTGTTHLVVVSGHTDQLAYL